MTHYSPKVFRFGKEVLKYIKMDLVIENPRHTSGNGYKSIFLEIFLNQDRLESSIQIRLRVKNPV
jgi:hypothetical protein